METPRRFVPTLALPPSSFVPGHCPHPPAGPAIPQPGVPPLTVSSTAPQEWRENLLYLYGLDLFNCGYYWEAHEAWEHLWAACGRRGRTAMFLKGLIKLAAAGVKVREGKPAGVRHHAGRAREIFEELARSLGDPDGRYMGLSPTELASLADQISRHPPEPGRLSPSAEPVFRSSLIPEPPGGAPGR